MTTRLKQPSTPSMVQPLNRHSCVSYALNNIHRSEKSQEDDMMVFINTIQEDISNRMHLTFQLFYFCSRCRAHIPLCEDNFRTSQPLQDIYSVGLCLHKTLGCGGFHGILLNPIDPCASVSTIAKRFGFIM